MKKINPNLLLGLGLMLLGAAQVTERYASLPTAVHYAILAAALMLELWGIILLARSPAMKNSKLRKWKLRLISKGRG